MEWFFLQLIGIITLLIVIPIIDSIKRKKKYRDQDQNSFNATQGQIQYYTGYSNQPNPYTASNYEPSTGFKEPPMYPYRKKNILTRAEYNFYMVLKRKCDQQGFIICPKVRLEDFIEVITQENRLKYRGYIRSRHVDFILCDRNLNIIAAIELDDSSHNTIEARKIDDFKNKLFRVVNIPLHRVPLGRVDFETAIEGIFRSFSLSHNNTWI